MDMNQVFLAFATNWTPDEPAPATFAHEPACVCALFFFLLPPLLGVTTLEAPTPLPLLRSAEISGCTWLAAGARAGKSAPRVTAGGIGVAPLMCAHNAVMLPGWLEGRGGGAGAAAAGGAAAAAAGFFFCLRWLVEAAGREGKLEVDVSIVGDEVEEEEADTGVGAGGGEEALRWLVASK